MYADDGPVLIPDVNYREELTLGIFSYDAELALLVFADSEDGQLSLMNGDLRSYGSSDCADDEELILRSFDYVYVSEEVVITQNVNVVVPETEEGAVMGSICFEVRNYVGAILVLERSHVDLAQLADILNQD